MFNQKMLETFNFTVMFSKVGDIKCTQSFFDSVWQAGKMDIVVIIGCDGI